MRFRYKMKIEDVFNSYKDNIVPSYTKTALEIGRAHV